jgi:hypothetical protein
MRSMRSRRERGGAQATGSSYERDRERADAEVDRVADRLPFAVRCRRRGTRPTVRERQVLQANERIDGEDPITPLEGEDPMRGAMRWTPMLRPRGDARRTPGRHG